VVLGVRRRLGAVGDAGLVEDVADVTAHGVQADDELMSDLLVRMAGGEEAEDLGLTG
jgi:hypothetical protein